MRKYFCFIENKVVILHRQMKNASFMVLTNYL